MENKVKTYHGIEANFVMLDERTNEELISSLMEKASEQIAKSLGPDAEPKHIQRVSLDEALPDIHKDDFYKHWKYLK